MDTTVQSSAIESLIIARKKICWTTVPSHKRKKWRLRFNNNKKIAPINDKR
jgi:hypothetical protein